MSEANTAVFRSLCVAMRGKPDLPPTQEDVDSAMAVLDGLGWAIVRKQATGKAEPPPTYEPGP